MANGRHISLNFFRVVGSLGDWLINDWPEDDFLNMILLDDTVICFDHCVQVSTIPMIKNFFPLLFIFLVACAGIETETVETAVSPTTPSGSLIFTQLEDSELMLVQMDVATKDVTTLFVTPDNGWLAFSDAAPDESQILLAYAPPPPAGEIQFGYTNLYTGLLEETITPRMLANELGEGETRFEPTWSADGRYVYYVHVQPDENDSGFSATMERLDNETGEVIFIASDAIWPRQSPTGAKLAYVTVDPNTAVQELILADADGGNPVSLLPDEMFEAVDVPFFSLDGTMIYFSGAIIENEQSFWDKLLGVKTAVAHNLPSDWWRVPVTGGDPELIADVDEVGLYGTFSPDGRFIAYISQTGVYLMEADGGNIEQLLSTTAVAGVSWIGD